MGKGRNATKGGIVPYRKKVKSDSWLEAPVEKGNGEGEKKECKPTRKRSDWELWS